jgi:hypothetical protein
VCNVKQTASLYRPCVQFDLYVFWIVTLNNSVRWLAKIVMLGLVTVYKARIQKLIHVVTVFEVVAYDVLMKTL